MLIEAIYVKGKERATDACVLPGYKLTELKIDGDLIVPISATNILSKVVEKLGNPEIKELDPVGKDVQGEEIRYWKYLLDDSLFSKPLDNLFIFLVLPINHDGVLAAIGWEGESEALEEYARNVALLLDYEPKKFKLEIYTDEKTRVIDSYFFLGNKKYRGMSKDLTASSTAYTQLINLGG